MKTKIINADATGIKEAAKLLRAGDLVAFPTETVYGLGADATNDKAVAGIYEAKGRPSFNPLIVHFADVESVKMQVQWNEGAEKLAAKFWPGALTFILPRSNNCKLALLVSGGLDTVAVRIPAHDVAHNLIEAAGTPIAAPSANTSGKISPTTADHVSASLGDKISCILDGGDCSIGLESTVVDLSAETPTLLRPGGITQDELASIIGPLDAADEDSALKSPGMLSRHYAPDVPIRLEAKDFFSEENVLGFGPAAPAGSLNLSASANLTEAAANLFAMLHELDQPGGKAIAVMPIPATGLGVAINDRLRRAASRE
jgi:L-threonylcarbamoyladenylate synthase